MESALSGAQVILMLISADFVAEELHGKIDTLIARGDTAPSRIPVLLSPVDLAETGLEPLQRVPRSGLAISQWQDKEQAWAEVAKELRQFLSSVRAP